MSDQVLTDQHAKQLNQQLEDQIPEEEVLEGTVQATASVATGNEEADLRSRITSGEWDNLDDLPAFQKRTPEGRLMARTEAIDYRIRQLEQRLPLLLNQHLHDAYIQVLKKIHALRKTKGALFYFSYKDSGQRDLNSGE